MTADIEKLKALALAATAGPWAMATDWDRAAVYSETHMVPRYKDEPINKRVVCSGNQNNMGRSGQEHWSGADWADAKYIAAANPAAVLELITDNERLRAEAKRYRWLRDKSEPGICAFYLSVGQAFKGVKFTPETVDAALDDVIEKEKA